MPESARHCKYNIFVFILRKKYLVLWNVAPLAAGRRLQVASKCAKLKPLLMPHMQTLASGLICERAGWLATIRRR